MLISTVIDSEADRPATSRSSPFENVPAIADPARTALTRHPVKARFILLLPRFWSSVPTVVFDVFKFRRTQTLPPQTWT
jgi:hypothetical protein